MRDITNRPSLIRGTYIAIIVLTYFVGNFILCFLTKTSIDQFICIISVNICYLLLFFLNLLRKRLDKELPEYNYISYGKITIALLLSWIITVFCVLVAPDFFAPIIIIPLICSVVFDESTNIISSIYFLFVISIFQNFNSHSILCYALLIIFGNMLSHYFKSDIFIHTFYGYILVFSINILISIVFYYFDFLEIHPQTFFYAVIESAIAVGFAAFTIPCFNKFTKSAQTDIYDTFLDPDFILCKEIHNFSYIEFQHACRVSRLSALCAQAIGVNEKLAACGGFYYRIGKLFGEPIIENGVKIANDHCFPEQLISIIFEYGGIISLPSCPESAIVHMVDTVVTKVELFDEDSMTSTWNQNMVIYQTINELSQKGLFDKSGLSMNQFLIIRDKLTKEDILQ